MRPFAFPLPCEWAYKTHVHNSDAFVEIIAPGLEHGLRPDQREIGADLRNRMKGG